MRERAYFLVTYCSIKELQEILDKKIDQISSYAYIMHDKDVWLEDCFDNNGVMTHKKGESKIEHIHLFLNFKNAREDSEVLNWFKKLKCNTFFERVRSVPSVIKYLTHNTSESIKLGKFRYSDSDVVTYNVDLNYCLDECQSIIDDMLAGKNDYELVCRWGKLYLYHMDQYAKLYYNLTRKLWSDLAIHVKKETYKQVHQEYETNDIGGDIVSKTENDFFKENKEDENK